MGVRATTSTTATVPFGIVDVYSGAAVAYSLRKLRGAYTGAAIRVRRSNDNAEQDIGFTAIGDLDEAALSTFVGANSGFIATWYDQSGNARNATQTTAVSQPRIVNAGVIDRQNGRPTFVFSGGQALSHLMTHAGQISSFITGNFNGTNQGFFQIGAVNTAGSIFVETPVIKARGGPSSDATIASSTQFSTFSTVLLNNVSGNIYRNLVQGITSIPTVPSVTNATSYIGILQSVYLLNGTISELIHYAADMASSRAVIDSNAISYYGIV